MTRASGILLVSAFLYPMGSWFLLWITSGPIGIPQLQHLILFGIVFPLFAIAIAVGAKLYGAKLNWFDVISFSIWLAVIGFFHLWFITALWASI
jgi:hypothetical protein